jgi:putative Holliday junction resolvase
MRILGIDYGRKRTGLAISDPLGITAQPLPAIQVPEAGSQNEPLELVLARKIAEVVREHGIDEVVVGLPRSMDGSLGNSGKRVMEFVDTLKRRLDCNVDVEDERLTTMMADKALAALGESPKVRKKKLDRVAAQLILQSYLDRKRTCEPQEDEPE